MRLLTRLTGTNKAGILAAVMSVLILCGTSWGSITRDTVSKAWERITRADGFRKVPIHYDKDDDPNAYVLWNDDGSFTVHVTTGLIDILRTEDEIAGVLGHELGHIQLGHYDNIVLTDTARTVMGTNMENIDPLSQAVGNMDMDLRESKFNREQETEADDYGTELLRKAGYNAWGLYNAMKRFDDEGYSSEHNGFNSHPASRERLAHLAEKAGGIQEHGTPQRKPSSNDDIDSLANILMGQ